MKPIGRKKKKEQQRDALRQYRVLNGAELAPVPSSAAIHDVHDGRHYSSGQEFRRREQRAMVIDDDDMMKITMRVYFGEKKVGLWTPLLLQKKQSDLFLPYY